MPSIKEFWPDRWLKPEHLADRRARVIIETVTVEQLFNPRTRHHEPRLIIAFHAKNLRMVLNRTQATALADITQTDDYTRWVGHEIILSRGTAPNGSPTIVISPVTE